jgi:hypothetical protein
MSLGYAIPPQRDWPELRQASEGALEHAYRAGSRPPIVVAAEDPEPFPCACGTAFALWPAAVAGDARTQYDRHLAGVAHQRYRRAQREAG